MKKIVLFLFILISITGLSQNKRYYKEQNTILNARLDSIQTVNSKMSVKTVKMSADIDSLKGKISQLETEVKTAKKQVADCVSKEEKRLKEEASKNETKTQVVEKSKCKATTQSGSQCTRDAESGSDYCWQHKDKAEVSSPSTGSSSGSGATGAGQKIYTGPRGGKYYINSNGKKTYIKH